MILTYEAKILDKKQLTEHVFVFTVTRPDNPDWTFKAGQYMIVHVPQEGTAPVRRLYSIASTPSQTEHLELVIEFIPNGIAGSYLKPLSIGDTITLQGPAGVFVLKESLRDKVFLATGTGIAPIRSMIKTLLEQNNSKNIRLFWGLKKCEDIYLDEELQELCKTHPNLDINLCLSREDSMPSQRPPNTTNSRTTLGRVTIAFETEIQNIHDYDYYICGGKEVVEAIRHYLYEKGIMREQIHFERFT